MAASTLPAVPGGRREQTKAANRTAILEAALGVFAELGYEAASVRDVIRRTELAAGTFYNYFPDKEAVFRALLEQWSEEARRRVRAARERAGDAEDFLGGAYEAYFAYLVEKPGLHAMLGRNWAVIRSGFEDVAVPFAVEELAADLRDAAARGALPAVRDVDYAARAMVAVGLELGQALAQQPVPDVAGATRFATELFLGGLERLAR